VEKVVYIRVSNLDLFHLLCIEEFLQFNSVDASEYLFDLFTKNLIEKVEKLDRLIKLTITF